MVWRVRYECHAPATAQTLDQTIKVCITHIDVGDGNELPPLLTPPHAAPNGDVVHHPNIGNCATALRTILIDQP